MKRIFSFLKFHIFGIILSLLIGFIIFAPPVFFHFSSDYKGVEMLKTNTESHYVTQIQEVYDGHESLGNPFFEKGKDEPYLFPPLSPNVIGRVGHFFGLGVIKIVWIARWFFSSLLSFCIYYFTFLLTKRRLAGLIAAPFVLLAYNLVDPGRIIDILKGGAWVSESSFIDYGRPINPQVSSVFFFVYLIFFYKYIFEKKSLWYGIVAALTFGLSFYVYLFTWTYIVVLNGCVGLFFLVKKQWAEVKRVLLVSGGAGVVGIPYGLHTLTVAHHPLYAEVAPRFGFVKSRTLELSRLMIGVTALFFLTWKKISSKVKIFLALVLATAFLTVNEHLITGKYVFNHHYHWYYNTPLAIIILTVLLFSVFEKKHIHIKIQKTVAIFCILFFLTNGIMIQKSSYQTVLPSLREEQRYASLFSWVRSNTPKDTTLLADSQISNLVPALTSDNVFYHGTAIYTLVSNKELITKYLALRYIEGISSEDIEAYIQDHESDIVGFVYGYTFAFQKGVCSSCAPAETKKQMVEAYKNFQNDSVKKILHDSGVDYVIYDKKTDPNWNLDRFGLKKIQEIQDFEVWSW